MAVGAARFSMQSERLMTDEHAVTGIDSSAWPCDSRHQTEGPMDDFKLWMYSAAEVCRQWQ